MLSSVALALAASPAAPSPAAARQARALTRRSMVEYDAGDFEKALADETRAYELDPLPALLFNLAQCHRALHHWEQAAFFYRRYLARAPAAKNRPQVEKLVSLVEAQANAERLHAVPLVSSAPKEEALHSAPGLLAPESDVAPVVVVRGEAPPSAAPSGWAYGTLGLAVGLGALGLGSALVASANSQAAQGMTRPVAAPNEWILNQRVGRSEGFGLAADALFVGAAASLVASGILFLVGSGGGSLALAPGAGGLAVAGF